MNKAKKSLSKSAGPISDELNGWEKPKSTEVAAMVVLYVAFVAGDNKLSSIISAAPDIELRAVGVVLVLILTLVRGNGRSRMGGGYWLFFGALWLGYLLLSTRWAPINVSSYRSATAELLWLAVMASLAVLTIGFTRYGSQVYLWWSAYGVGILFALAGLASGAGSQGRFSAFGGGPNTFVRVVFIGLLAAVVLATYRGQARYLIPVPLLVVAVLLSGSRGGLVASALATLFLLGAIYLRVGLRAIVASIAGVGAALGLLAFGSPLGNEVRELLAQRVVTEAIGEGNLSGRSGLYAEAIRVFLENPLFGVGASGFAQVQTVISGESHAHNLILSTLAEGGVLGGAFLALALYACSRRLQCGSKASILAVGASAGAIFIFVAAQFSGYYFDFRLFFLFVALAGSSSIAARSESRNDGVA